MLNSQGAFLSLIFAVFVCLPVDSLAACPALKKIETYQDRKSVDYAYLIGPYNGWLFRTRGDLKQDFSIKPQTISALRRLQENLGRKNIQLVIMPIPTKGMVHSNDLGSDVQYDKSGTWESYLKLTQDLSSAGILAPDMSGADLIKDFYWKEDSHWNAEGARFSAQKIADRLKDLTPFQGIPEIDFVTRRIDKQVQKKLGYLDFYNSNCVEKLPYSPAQYVWETERAEAANTENDLFSDENSPEIVLVGTSNSTAPGPSYANFDGFLKEYTKRDIRNEAVAGGALGGSILQYFLSDDYKSHPPKFLIWEFPVHNSLNNDDILREIVPAALGECSAGYKLLTRKISGADISLSLFPDLSALKFPSLQNYLSLKFGKDSPRQFSLTFYYKDGITDKVKLNRPLRIFPENNGQYYADFSNGLGELVEIVISAKEPIGDVEASICEDKNTQNNKVQTSKHEIRSSNLWIERIKASLWPIEKRNNYEINYNTDPDISDIVRPIVEPQNISFPALSTGKVIPASETSLKLAGRLSSFPDAENQKFPIIIYSGSFDLASLKAATKEEVVTETPQNYILNYPIIIYPNASLTLSGLTKPLLLSQESGAYISSSGSFYVHNSTLVGWSEKENREAQLNKISNNFRPFIAIWDGGSIYAQHSVFKNLGFNSDKAYGISLVSSPEIQSRFNIETEEPAKIRKPRAVLRGNRFEALYGGLNASGGDEIEISKNIFKMGKSDALHIQGRVKDLRITANEISLTKGHGIYISSDAGYGIIEKNTIINNSGSGIYFGAESSKFYISQNEIKFNNKDGISIYESKGHNLTSNKMEYNKGAGLRVRNSRDITVVQDYAGFNKDFGFIAYGPETSANFIDLKSISNKGSLKTDRTGSLNFNFLATENIFGGDLNSLQKTIRNEITKNHHVQIKFIPEEKQ